ncbi:MAG: long-chain fatty acid--CoA ligase [Gemmatimonadota bacterium]|nr:long-chain fatty acid--CoA ligase [Gemmatimonadota bacterium]
MNIGTLLTKSARTYPQNLAVACGPRRWTYARFNERVNRLAHAFRRLGVRRGAHVAILMQNLPEMLESMFACFKAGAAAVPINFRLHPNEYAFVIDHSESELVVISSQFNAPVSRIRDRLPGVRHVVTIADAHERMLDYETLIRAESAGFDDTDVDPDDVAWVFYTSGTTAQPKGALLTHRNLLAMTMNFYSDICQGFGPGDVALHAAPLSHGSGLYALPNVGKAAANIIPETVSFDVDGVLEAIEKHRVTNMFAAPTMVKRMAESPVLHRYDLRSLKILNYGGGPMLAGDLRVAIEKLGPCLVQLYGQGESPMTITVLPHRDHVLNGAPQQMKRLSSVGIARTDVEIRILDEAGYELPPGDVGQIVTRSDLVMKGYWRNPEATAAALKDGWLHTGDVGYMDEDGYVFLLDRSKDLIISGGENIYPREIEEVLIRHPAVFEVAVIGVPHPEWGEAVKAVVVKAPGCDVSGEELIDFCKGRIASFKKPGSVDFVEELPRNNYGKVVKNMIRAPYWRGRESRVV